ncbi:MAG: hypothetical protein GY803_18005 [Chloroflexi bacterium]|nr:hypothetical protein [Chloroflexota bacterium]
MNFPDTILTQLLYDFINNPSIGGIVVGILALIIAISIFFTLRWVAQGAEVEETESYAYPTTALHHHE